MTHVIEILKNRNYTVVEQPSNYILMKDDKDEHILVFRLNDNLGLIESVKNGNIFVFCLTCEKKYGIILTIQSDKLKKKKRRLNLELDEAR